MVSDLASIKILNEGQTTQLFFTQPTKGDNRATPRIRWRPAWVREADTGHQSENYIRMALQALLHQ